MTFWKYLKDLFKEAEQSSPNQPVIHEIIKRSEKEQLDFEQWKKTLARRRLLDWLNAQYAIFLTCPNDIDEAIDFLNTPSSKGFVIHFHQTKYSKREIIHFFDALKEQVRALNYRSYVSDLKTYNRKNWVETTQRHYLKPPASFKVNTEGKSKQAYGNITIEIVLRDEKVYQLKFSATTYKDHLFEEATEFKDLMQELTAI